MKIAVLGANTALGKMVVTDAEREGIQVTSIVSTPVDLVGSGPVMVKESYELSLDELNRFYAVIDAVSFPLIAEHVFVDLPIFHLAASLKNSSCRYLGFGSCYILFTDHKKQETVMDCEGMFYEKGQNRAYKIRELMDKISGFQDFNYTLLCPPLNIREDAYPTGRFKFFSNILPMSDLGESTITLGDLSLAMIELLKRCDIKDKIIAVCNV